MDAMSIVFLFVMVIAVIIGYMAGYHKDKAASALYVAEDKLSILAAWADKFVAGAAEFLGAKTGEEKLQSVVEHLSEIADEAGIAVTKDQLEAIAQTAYNSMKYGQQAADRPMYYRIGERAVANPGAGGVVVINNTYGETLTDDEAGDTNTQIKATNDVPPGALEPNNDGTYNTYDADGNKTGTISAEEYEAAGEMTEGVQISAG